MSGVAILVQLGLADDTLAGLVSSTDDEPNIMQGALPQGTPLPALSMSLVSGVPHRPLAPGQTRHVTDHVQATGLATNYPELDALLAAAVHAFDGTILAEIDSLEGISDVVVHFESKGPDFMNEEASIHQGSRDFRVAYTETR